MKLVKTFLWILLVMIVAAIVTGLFLPQTVTVRRVMLISGPADAIFEQVNTIRNWPEWSPWHQADTSMIITYAGPEKGVSASYKWESREKKSWKGCITIIESMPYDSLLLDMDFLEKGKALGKFLFSHNDSGTLVKWSLSCDLGKNPFHRYYGLLMDRLVGSDFEKGLQNIQKKIATEPQSMQNYQVSEAELPSGTALTIRDTCTPESIGTNLAKIYTRIFNIIKTKNLKATGPPFAIYHTVSSDILDVEAGVFVNKRIRLNDTTMIFLEMEPRPSVKACYSGTYNESRLAYSEIEKYARLKKLQVSAPVIEEYSTDPFSEPDSSKWQINIYVPVK